MYENLGSGKWEKLNSDPQYGSEIDYKQNDFLKCNIMTACNIITGP